MKKSVLIISVLFLSVIIGFYGCAKEESESAAELTTAASDDAVSEKLIEDAFSQVDKYGSENLAKTVLESEECTAVVTVSFPEQGKVFPRIITVDFGTGCESANGVTRKGKIKISLAGSFFNVNGTRVVTFEDYYVNDFKIEGTKTITNTGYNDKQQPQRTIALVGGKVTFPDGETVITREVAHTKTWVEGSTTPFNITDDVWQISGTVTGKTAKGKVYNNTILEPLQLSFGCKHINQGKLQITTENGTATINYGDGTCDAKATISINAGEAKEFNLRNW